MKENIDLKVGNKIEDIKEKGQEAMNETLGEFVKDTEAEGQNGFSELQKSIRDRAEEGKWPKKPDKEEIN